jgi:hypothetical protein
MSEPNNPSPALLILHANGSIETPGAQTYGDILARLNVCEQLAGRIRQQILNTPLPVAQDNEIVA